MKKEREIIEIRDLKFAYMGEEDDIHFAINGIDLNIKKGEFMAILGHNGSGKSTLSKHINALLNTYLRQSVGKRPRYLG